MIVSLEVHTNAEQQQMMVDIMSELWAPYLVQKVHVDDSTPLPTLESLRNKILIKVKYSAKQSEAPELHSKDAEGTVDHSSDEEPQMEAVKKGKIIEALGNLGIYTRCCHFKSFDQPEADVPTHVFALSEKKLISIHEEDPEGLFQHNKVRRKSTVSVRPYLTSLALPHEGLPQRSSSIIQQLRSGAFLETGGANGSFELAAYRRSDDAEQGHV